MTGDEYKETIEQLGLNQVTAAEFLRVAERTSRRYAIGIGIPFAVELLLRWMIADKMTADDVLKRAKLKRVPR